MRLFYRVCFISALIVLGGVSLNALSTSHLADNQYLSNNTTPKMSPNDKAIVSAIQQLISQDPLLKNFNISPSSKDGNVTLDGTVDSAEQEAAAIADSKKVSGVKDVKSNIIVKNSSQ